MGFQRDSRCTDAGMNSFNDKLDLLDRILTKNLAWISSADTKGTLLFAVDSAMLGVLAAIVPSVNRWSIAAAIFTTLASLALAASVCFIVAGMFPRIAGPRNSLVFFGGIASHDEDQYVRKILDGVTEDLLADFARQCHRNAEIAKAKYDLVRKAVVCMFLALPFWLSSIWLLYSLKFAISGR